MAILHLDITTISDYAVESSVKVDGNIITKAYFTRNVIRISSSPTNDWLTVLLPNGINYILTHNQGSDNPEIYVVDTVDAIAPTSLLDLAAKLSVLIKH